MTSVQTTTSQPSSVLFPTSDTSAATSAGKKPNPLQKIKAALDEKAKRKQNKTPEERLDKPISRPVAEPNRESLHAIMLVAKQASEDLALRRKAAAVSQPAADKDGTPAKRAWAWVQNKMHKQQLQGVKGTAKDSPMPVPPSLAGTRPLTAEEIAAP